MPGLLRCALAPRAAADPISIISTTVRTRTAGLAWCDSNSPSLRAPNFISVERLREGIAGRQAPNKDGPREQRQPCPALPSSTCSRLSSLATEFPREQWSLAWRRSREAHCQVGSPSPVRKNTMPAPFEPPTFRRHSRGLLSDHSAGPAWCEE